MDMRKWNYETRDYEEYSIPGEWNSPLYLPAFAYKTEVNCASCGTLAKYGEMYTSKEIHNSFGLGYPVCSKCYDKEWDRRYKYDKLNKQKC